MESSFPRIQTLVIEKVCLGYGERKDRNGKFWPRRSILLSLEQRDFWFILVGHNHVIVQLDSCQVFSQYWGKIPAFKAGVYPKTH